MMSEKADYALVLAGGGARGFAHVGVLRGLELSGRPPSAIVGVSMGAVVATAYALNPQWYRDIVEMEAERLLGGRTGVQWGAPANASRALERIRGVRAMWRILRGWGISDRARSRAASQLRWLTRGRDLRDGRIPIAVCATDLRTGSRVVLERGRAAEAAYASSALAGVLPPLELEGGLLCDGAYADLVPVDVARRLGPATVVAVNTQQSPAAGEIRSGFEALIRAVEICYQHHAGLRFDEADLVIRPRFRRPVDVLDFAAKRECIAAGLRAVRRGSAAIADRLE